jgi:hypothetical protein
MKTECGREVNTGRSFAVRCPARCCPGIEEADFDSLYVGGVACDEREVVNHGGCGEEGVDDGARAVGGELAPEAGNGGVNAEDVIGEAQLQAVDPCGELLGRGRIGALWRCLF